MSSYHTSFTYKDKNSFDEGYIIVAFEPDNGFKDTFLSMDNISDEYYDGTKRFDYGSKYNTSSEIQITIIKKDGTDMSVKDFRSCAKWLTGARINSWLDMHVGDKIIYSFFGKFLNLEQYKLDARTVGCRLTFSSLSPWAYSAPESCDCYVGQVLSVETETYEIVDYEHIETEYANRTISSKDNSGNWDIVNYANDYKIVDGVITLVSPKKITLDNNGSYESVDYNRVETEVTNEHISYKNTTSTDPSSYSWDRVDYADEIDISTGKITLIDSKNFLLGDTSNNSVILGKYIKSGYTNKFYRIPDTATIIHSKSSTPGSHSEYMIVDHAIELSVEKTSHITNINPVILGKYIHTTYDNNYYFIHSEAELSCDGSNASIKASSVVKHSVKSTTSILEDNVLYNASTSIEEPVETNVSNVTLSYQTSDGDDYDNVSYADDYAIIDGEISLINPITITISSNSDVETIIGKYIYSDYNDAYYKIPSTARPSFGTNIGEDNKYYTYGVSDAIQLTVKKSTGSFGMDGSVLILNPLAPNDDFIIDDDGTIYIDTSYSVQINNQSDDLYTYIYLDVDYENESGNEFYFTNETLDEETIVTGLSDGEKISISAKQFIMSDKPDKIFGDTFNFIWPRLAPGINDINISGAGTGKAQFTYRYPMKIGDCTMDIDVYGNGIDCGCTGGTADCTVSERELNNMLDTVLV